MFVQIDVQPEHLVKIVNKIVNASTVAIVIISLVNVNVLPDLWVPNAWIHVLTIHLASIALKHADA